MKQAILTAVALVAVALAGCTSDDGNNPPALTEADCDVQGLVLAEVEHHDNETGEHHTALACVEAGPPATATITGLPEQVSAYTRVDFEWVLDTGIPENHAMLTSVRVSTESVPDDQVQRPGDYGIEVAKREHQNFAPGTAYDAVWVPSEPGTYYLRAYAQVQGTNIWSTEHAVEVGPIEPTGVVHEIEVEGLGLPIGGLSEASLTIALGDAVSWSAGDPDSYTITATNPAGSFSTSTGGDPVLFITPGSYTYSAEGTLGSYTGRIEVRPPTME